MIYIVEMTRGKTLAAVEKNIIVKDTAKGITQEGVAKTLVRHVRTLQRYLDNLAPRKTESDEGVSTTVTARDRP